LSQLRNAHQSAKVVAIGTELPTLMMPKRPPMQQDIIQFERNPRLDEIIKEKEASINLKNNINSTKTIKPICTLPGTPNYPNKSKTFGRRGYKIDSKSLETGEMLSTICTITERNVSNHYEMIQLSSKLWLVIR
jgi:hypothetical protein